MYVRLDGFTPWAAGMAGFVVGLGRFYATGSSALFRGIQAISL